MIIGWAILLAVMSWVAYTTGYNNGIMDAAIENGIAQLRELGKEVAE